MRLRDSTPALALLLGLLAACASGPTRRHAATTPPSEGPPGITVTEARKGQSYTQRITCGMEHEYVFQMAAQEVLHVTLSATLEGNNPLGEDFDWRFLGPNRNYIANGELVEPGPGRPAPNQQWDVTALDAERYILAVHMESGQACAHLEYTIAFR
ncbi:MAG: hypothetical protein HY909_09460 [Deltaproteobacteria bacterium]|nr:hypothetical protein [Deltaproteobacteria bacterium]